MNILQTFASAQGWTVNHFSTTNDWLALSNGSVFVQFRWDNSSGIAMFHSTGFVNSSTAPGNHTNDDGCGLLDASTPYNSTVNSGRRIVVGNGPFTAYHFFTDNTTKYIHVALEYAPGLYRHFAFGTIDKVGNWTGGQYAAATHWEVAAQTIPASGNHSVLWDGLYGNSFDVNVSASVRVEGMPNQTGSMRWMLLNDIGSQGTDRGGNARVRGLGGTRSGPLASQMLKFRANLANGYVPLVRIPIFWVDPTPTPDQWMFLGNVSDVRVLQIANITVGQELAVGSDTWKIFPFIRKQAIASGEESRNAGIAYRKVV
jgi:hypothetical protein